MLLWAQQSVGRLHLHNTKHVDHRVGALLCWWYLLARQAGGMQTNFLCQSRCGKRKQEDRGLGTWHQTRCIIFDSKWKPSTGSPSKGDPFSLLLLFSRVWCGRQEHSIRKTSSRSKLAFKALQIVFTGNYINPRQLLSLFKWTSLAISSSLTCPFSKGSTCMQSSLCQRQQPKVIALLWGSCH